MLRSGPAITPHFAHRPRQSCRRGAGRTAVRPLRLEQLTLFDLEPEPIPAFYWEPVPADEAPRGPEPRRRKAWFPRLVRWVRARTGRAGGTPEG